MKLVLMFVAVMMLAFGALAGDGTVTRPIAPGEQFTGEDGATLIDDGDGRVRVVPRDPAIEINECFDCQPVEIFQYVGQCYDYLEAQRTNLVSATGTETVNCYGAMQYWSGWQKVLKETGFKRKIIATLYDHSAITTGHSSSFQAWWEGFVVGTTGSGSGALGSTPVAGTAQGSTNADQGSMTETCYTSDSWSIPYTVKTWWCAASGGACEVSTSVQR